jgi:hypothetical protein
MIFTSFLFILMSCPSFAHTNFFEGDEQSLQAFAANDQVIHTSESKQQDPRNNDSKEVSTLESVTVKPGLRAYLVPGFIGLVVLAGIGAYWIVIRNKIKEPS